MPDSSILSTLERSEENYDVEFDNAQWKLEKARVEAEEKEIESLGCN